MKILKTNRDLITKDISLEKQVEGNQFVAVIGASAGGLEAIHDFFDHEGNAKLVSYVVIQHLSPDHKSLLVELVSKHTEMSVIEAGEGMNLKPGHVYIIPNNKLITIHDNRFKLNDKGNLKLPNTAIDTFLFSLAKEKGEKAIAIILSGTGSDGTKGIQAIKDARGTVYVQEPNSAKFDGMPNSAINSGNVDFILAPKDIASSIEKIVKNYYFIPKDISTISDTKMEKIFSLVYDNSGHDFNYYKTPTIIRRIEKRMVEKGIDNLDNYIAYLETSDVEGKKLGEEFLIGVTSFFRDKPAFDLIHKDIIPDILKGKKNKDTIKVWVCACSTGEEAYSLAILIDKCLKSSISKPEVKIFATDIDENSLKIAQKGEYPLSISKEVDPATLSEYFIRHDNHYTIIPHIRKQIVFASHNVIQNPPFIKNDLVSCRNMLIYLNPILQHKLLSTFHFSLNEGGYLFLGSSESANYIKEGIIEISSKNKVYKKINNTNFLNHELSTHSYTQKIDKVLLESTKHREKNSKLELHNNLEFYNLLIEDLNYVGIVIDSEFNIKDSMGDFKRYLSLPEKKLNLNILKMVPLEISGTLSTAIRKSRKNGETIVLYKDIQNVLSKNILCRIVVKPIQDKKLTLILFNEVEERESKLGPANDNVTFLTDIKQSEYIQEIEAELSETKSDLQALMEEMETANEELQSSNEELLSANEELQSSNEELQSLNEELHTLNAEHQIKIKELTDLNDDLDNYFRNTDLAQIFVDRDLKVRKFNPAAIKIINLINSDIGRPITHISTNILYDRLIEDLRSIISEEVQSIEKEIVLKNGTKRMLRISPYLRQDKIRDGAVVSFVDISVFDEVNNIIKSAFNASNSAIIAYKAIRDIDYQITDFKYLTGNAVALNRLGIDEDQALNQSFKDQFSEIFDKQFFKNYIKVVDQDIIFQKEFKDKSQIWCELTAVKMRDGIVVTINNIADKKSASDELQQNYDDLIVTKNSLRQLNTGLKSEIKERTKELNTSQERFNYFSTIITDSLWDWDLESGIIWRSPKFTTMFGQTTSPPEISNQEFWMKKIHAEEREKIRIEIYKAINNPDISEWTAEYRYLKDDGYYTSVLDRAQIIRDTKGVAKRMLGTVIDISKTVELNNTIKRQQKEFENIFINAPAHIVIKRGENLVYDFINKEASEFYNLYDVIGKPTSQVKLHWEGADMTRKERKVMKTGKPISEKNYKITYYNKAAKSEIVCWFDYMIEPVFNHLGEVEGVVIFSFNVTDRIKAQKETDLLLERKDEFLSIASHELRTPLTSIKGFVQLLEKRTEQDDSLKTLNELAKKSSNQINKLANLINDLLDVTKIRTGKLKLNPSSFNAKELMKDSLEGFSQHIHHTIDLETNDDVMLHADKNMIEQVINNLISNAIKYSPQNDKIIIKSEIKHGMYYFSVEDFGIGVPPEKVDFIFQRFFRANDTSDYTVGVGLGLYIASEIIKKHKGRIQCKSTFGKGSLFWFTIPIIYIS